VHDFQKLQINSTDVKVCCVLPHPCIQSASGSHPLPT